jgi:hypothetical protein
MVMTRSGVSLLLQLVALLLLAAPAARADNDNAATWYERALESMQRRLSVEDMNYLGDYASSPTVIPAPTPELRAIIGRARNAVDLARRGSRQSYSDFQLDYGQGLDLMLPHLSSIRVLEQVMRADALVRIADGDASGGVDVLASSVRMAGHLAEDRTLISSLVGRAIFNHADGGLQHAIDQAALTPELSATLLASVSSLNGDDPFGMADAVAMEQEVMIDWLARRFEADGGMDLLAKDLTEMWMEQETAQLLVGLDEESFYAAIGQYDGMMDGVVEAFSIDDPELAAAMLEQIDAEIAAGEHGLLAKVFEVEYARIFRALLESRQAVAARARVLEKLASEAADPVEHANAVAMYLKAIEQLEGLPHLDRLRAHDADPSAPADAELLKLLSLTGPVVDLVRRASTTRRCDFASVRFVAWPMVAQAYAPGFRDLYRLLHADARRLTAIGAAADARDRLETALRMTAHLSLDQTLGSGLVADEGCRRTLALIEPALADGAMSEAARESLSKAFRRIGRADAFGFLAAEKRARRGIVGTVAFMRATGGRLDLEERDRVAAVAEGWSADVVLSLVAVTETMTRSIPDHSPRCPDVHYARLDMLPGLDAARREAETVQAALKGEDPWPLLAEPKLPPVADVQRRIDEARSLMRRGQALLRPATPAGVSGPAGEADPAPDGSPDGG